MSTNQAARTILQVAADHEVINWARCQMFAICEALDELGIFCHREGCLPIEPSAGAWICHAV